MDKKRFIIASVFLLFCIAIGYLLYLVFFAKKAPDTGVDTGVIDTTTGQFPTADEGELDEDRIIIDTTDLPTAGVVPGRIPSQVTPQVERVVEQPISGTNFDTSGRANFYDKTDGKFYRLLPDGSVKALSDDVFYNVDKVTWSPVKTESIIEYPDGSNIYYNFETKEQVTLPKHWEDFSFSNLGDKIAAKSIGIAEENRWLITAEPQGKNIKLVEPMGNNASKVTVDWSPNNQIIATSLTGEALGSDRQEVLFVGQNGENFQSIIVEGRGIISEWSPQGKKLLYSVYSARNNFNPELWIVNADVDSIGTGRKYLSVNTWADKCTFSNDRFVYCGVPTDLELGSGFAPELARYTPDKLIKIDTQTGIKTEIRMDENHTIEEIFVGEYGETIYFTDKNQTGLFSTKL